MGMFQCQTGVARQPQEIIDLFDRLFFAGYATRLCFGPSDPEYLPCSYHGGCHRILFAHGFFASALHEVAHWCVAGPERRQLVDYGYWYRPDGRSEAEQREFSSVEVKPQALEWIFSVAAGITFHFSADNLGTGGSVVSADWYLFQDAVLAQVHAYLSRGLPARAAAFAAGLRDLYGTGQNWQMPESYKRCKL